jgi:hypothetical protein
MFVGVDGFRLTGALTLWKVPHAAWRPNPEWPQEVGFATWDSSDAYVFPGLLGGILFRAWTLSLVAWVVPAAGVSEWTESRRRSL